MSHLSLVASQNVPKSYSQTPTVGAGFSIPLFSRISPLSPSTFSTLSLTDSLASLAKHGPRIAKLNLLPLETYQSFALGGYTVQAQRAPSVTNANAASFLDRLSLTVFCSLSTNKDSSRCSYDTLLALQGTPDTTTILGYPVEETPVVLAVATSTPVQPVTPSRIVYVPQYIT
ncbi:MAG: hypothetical protein KBC50_03180, partial [Candidatus Pacebacteria bacterium]|nr:hypothetical protein [Candidatus Paceibacterota bacterium]